MKKIILPISVILPTYNRSNSLFDTLNSFCNSDYIPEEILIIDQSDDENALKKNGEINTKFEDLNIIYIHLDCPSLTKARNVGLSKASHNIVVCSDDDICVEYNTFYNIFKIMSESNTALIGGFNSLCHNTSFSLFGFLAGFKRPFCSKRGYFTKSGFGRLPRKLDDENLTSWAMGFFMAFRRDIALKNSIQWDENLLGYAYGEDLDFSMRYCKIANLLGFKTIYTNRVVVKHLVSHEFRVSSLIHTKMYFENRYYIIKKNNLSKTFLPFYWTNLFTLIMAKKLNMDRLCIRKSLYDLKQNKQAIINGDFTYNV